MKQLWTMTSLERYWPDSVWISYTGLHADRFDRA